MIAVGKDRIATEKKRIAAEKDTIVQAGRGIEMA